MLPADSQKKLEERAGPAVAPGATPRDAFAAMLSFYADVRPELKLVHEEGDMLLYEWGSHRAPAVTETFTLCLTRQLIVFPSGADEQDFEPEDGMSHLILRLHFQATSVWGRGQRWCPDPGGLVALRAFIDASVPWQALADTPAQHVTLDWSRA